MTGRRFLRHLALDGPDRYLDASTMFHADEMRRAVPARCARADRAARPVGRVARRLARAVAATGSPAVQYRDLNRYLPLDILTKVDRMTMAHSIEARPPLLDHKFVEFAATIPARFRLRDGDDEVHLQAGDARHPAGRDHRSAEARLRRAAGALVPRRAGRVRARSCCSRTPAAQRGIFDTRYVERLFQLHQRGRDLDLQLWTMLSFELWCRRFLDTTDVRDVAPARTRQTLKRPAAPAIVRARYLNRAYDSSRPRADADFPLRSEVGKG